MPKTSGLRASIHKREPHTLANCNNNNNDDDDDDDDDDNNTVFRTRRRPHVVMRSYTEIRNFPLVC
jgi:hypothetical protein